ncbi:nuclear transport factor 2 family protein [Gilvimarinus chinensis]|uniref:nuclear transport factor 2 family protein n=1 Tax=Gilvimarinus chinensis TaxID=396005 RepID=UPI00037B5BF0|nr:nuclear transport factor 2 family protein [Gilvimarinus chinensis]
MKTDVTPSGQCKNSAKNQNAETLAIALATGDAETAERLLAEGAVWQTACGKTFIGTEIYQHLEQLKPPKSLVITHVLTHGKSGAVNAQAKAKESYRQCDIFEFTNTKAERVRKVMSYRVAV